VRVAQVADSGDAITLDGHIGGVPRVAGAVDNVAIADEDVVVRAATRGRSGRRRSIKRSVIRSRGDFAQCLAGNGLRGFWIGRQRNVIHVGGERELLAAFGDDEAGEPFAVEHHFAIELVLGAERAGFCEDVAGTGIVDLNFGESAVFPENGHRFEEDRKVGPRAPVGHVVGNKVRAEEVRPVSSFAVALRDAREIELGVLKESALNLEACVYGIAAIFRNESP